MQQSIFIRFLALILLVGFLNVAGDTVIAYSGLPVTVTSPNKTIKLPFGLKTFLTLSTDARPYYLVDYRGATLVEDSPLGIDVTGAPPLDRNFFVKGITRQSIRNVWQTVVGKTRTVQDRGEQVTVSLFERNAPRRQINIVLRAYDDGIALRYEWPQQPQLSRFQITAEKTEFRFPANYTVWALQPGFHAYESEYQKKTLDNLLSDKLQALPLLMSAGNGRWMALVEADLTEYAGMYVSRNPTVPHALVTALPGHRNNPAIKVETHTPGRSPWRVLMIGQTPGALIESNLVLNLSRPSAIQDPSWIEPGKAAWNWWSDSVVDDPTFLAAGNKPGMNTATMKHYIDFAARMGFEYSVIDAGWYNQEPRLDGDITKPNEPAVNIREIVAHAKANDVKIILWIHSSLTDRQMNQAFPLYEQWGISGVKIDFMDSDEQTMVAFYERALKKAAEHHLVVDFHGAFKPTGLNRTWPNELTREGVLGLEHAKWSQRPDPEHNVILPFTRMLTGPIDYTPGGFTNSNGQDYTPRGTRPIVSGTRCHQLAMYVVYESELAMVSDFPENILGQVGADFLRHVPTSWEETRVLNGEPGDYVTIARKHGSEWYLGAMTDLTPRSLTVGLGFLGSGRYIAEVYEDDPSGLRGPQKIAFHKSTVTAKKTLTAHLASGGGFAVRFYPTW